MTIVVRLSGDVDRVVASAATLGVQLRPLHPGTSDPDLARWFVADAADEESATDTLRALPGISAAYTKPADEPPAL